MAGRAAPSRARRPEGPVRGEPPAAGAAVWLVVPGPGAAPRRRRRAVLVPRSRGGRGTGPQRRHGLAAVAGRAGRGRARPVPAGECGLQRGPGRAQPGRARPDGRTTSAAGGSATYGRSSCTSSPRPRSTPGTSTRHANCSTAAPGWARRTRGSRAAERAAPGTTEHRRKAAAWRTGKGRSAR